MLRVFTQISHNTIWNSGLTEINAQPEKFTRKRYSGLNSGDLPKGFSSDLFLYLIGMRSVAAIIEIPVDFASRQFGEAKSGGASLFTIAKILVKTLRYILKMKNSLKVLRHENRTAQS